MSSVTVVHMSWVSVLHLMVSYSYVLGYCSSFDDILCSCSYGVNEDFDGSLFFIHLMVSYSYVWIVLMMENHMFICLGLLFFL